MGVVILNHNGKDLAQRCLHSVVNAVYPDKDIILVDNLPLEEVREAVRRIAGRAKVELSGGITLDRIPELARTGAHYVSVGALTHSAPAADLSFELEVDESVKASAAGSVQKGIRSPEQ